MSDADTEGLLDKADALIRRHRVFIAGAPAPTLESALDDDLPVLTEVVSDAALATAPPHMQEHLDALREELTRWLNEELPHAVLKVTDGLADQLMGELTHQAEQQLLPRLIARLDGSASAGDRAQGNVAED